MKDFNISSAISLKCEDYLCFVCLSGHTHTHTLAVPPTCVVGKGVRSVGVEGIVVFLGCNREVLQGGPSPHTCTLANAQCHTHPTPQAQPQAHLYPHSTYQWASCVVLQWREILESWCLEWLAWQLYLCRTNKGDKGKMPIIFPKCQ